MPSLYVTIAGANYEVIEDGAEQGQSTHIGEKRRAFAGNWISSIRLDKREWKFAIYFDNAGNTSFDVLQAAVARGQIVSCGGPLIGSTIDCVVDVTSAPFIPKGVDNFRRGCLVTVSEN